MFWLPVFATLLAAPAAWGQFQQIDVRFEGIGCATCIESLPARLKRMRGVESVRVDSDNSTVHLKLADQNRVRLEQVRDAIEQDGTRANSARVVVRGTVHREGGVWLLRPGSTAGTYELGPGHWTAGDNTIEADAGSLHPPSGRILLVPR